MGCGCRGGIRKASPRAFVEPPVAGPSTRSLCPNIESDGNNLTVRVGADGRLYFTFPSAGDIPAVSLISSAGCRGAFSQAVAAANTKLTSIYLSPAAKSRFLAGLPGANVKLGFLREILRTF
jgi:hypothetical protein